MNEHCQLRDCVRNLARVGKIATAWEGPPCEVKYDKRQMKKTLQVTLTRRGAYGEEIAAVRQSGDVYTSFVGGPASASATKTAGAHESLHEALEEADSQLEAAGYLLLGKLALMECGDAE